jgi:hypothetical protein
MKITDKIKLDFRHNTEQKVTACILTNGEQEFVGYARCSESDSFDRKIGRKLALVRVLKDCNLNREERTKIWQTLRERGVKLTSSNK